MKEVIASMRGHVMWARTSRVDEPIDFDIEDCGITNSENLEVESLRNEMMYLKNSETRQDEYRLLMPVIGITRYTIRISLSYEIKLCHYFNKLKTELTGIPSVIFGEAANKFIQFLHDSFPAHADLTKVVSSYRTVDIVPALKENEMQSGQVGDFIVISVVIPFSLRTHLIRHNSLHIKDNLIEFFDDEDIHKKTINDKMNVQISASRSFWTHVLKERSCWMSHDGMWKQIMSELSNIVMQNETFLPCGGCGDKCPYSTDAMLRFEGKDPNPPCPIHAVGNGFMVPIKTKTKMLDMIVQDDRPNFWLEKIEELSIINSGY